MPTTAASPRTPVKKRGLDRRLSLGRVVLAPVSMEHTLLKLAHELVSLSADLNIRLPKAHHRVSKAPGKRPCILLDRTASGGQRVIPMGTFSGMAPEEWDLLLREIALPVGDDDANISPALHGRKLYDSIPPWVQADGLPAYILPRIVILPAGYKLQPLVEVVPEADVKDLEAHCQNLAQHMVSENTHEVLSILINSFLMYRKQQKKTKKKNRLANDTGSLERPLSQCSDYSESASSIASTSTLNPVAKEFVPRLLPSVGSVHSIPTDTSEAHLSPLRFHKNMAAAARARTARKATTQLDVVDTEVEKENVPA